MRKGYIEDLAQQGSDEWLSARKGIITASNTPFTMDGKLKSTWKSYAREKFSEMIIATCDNMELVAEVEETDTKKVYKTSLMTRGNERERITAKKYTDTFLKADEHLIERGFIYSPGELLGASIDREIVKEERELIEIKNPKFSTYMEYATDEKALYRKYFIQAQIQLYVTGLKKCTIVADYPYMELVTAEIYLDDNFIKNLEKSLKKYKEYIIELFKNFNKNILK